MLNIAKTLGMKESEMLSIVLTREEHLKFTREWRRLIPYGKGTKGASKEKIKAEAKKIYKDYPIILNKLGL